MTRATVRRALGAFLVSAAMLAMSAAQVLASSNPPYPR